MQLSSKIIKSIDSANSKSSRKVILSNHNVSSQVFNRMHESINSDQLASPEKKKAQPSFDENGVAVLQVESADCLNMFDRLPLGTQRGPTGPNSAFEKAQA